MSQPWLMSDWVSGMWMSPECLAADESRNTAAHQHQRRAQHSNIRTMCSLECGAIQLARIGGVRADRIDVCSGTQPLAVEQRGRGVGGRHNDVSAPHCILYLHYVVSARKQGPWSNGGEVAKGNAANLKCGVSSGDLSLQCLRALTRSIYNVHCHP